jgi:multidrug efflux pump subunit AcrA (membrane-fusion protein)
MLFEQPQGSPIEEAPAPVRYSSRQSAILKYVLLAIAAIYVVASLYLLYDMRNRLMAVEQKQQALETAQAELGNRIHATSTEFKQQLSSEVGMTKAEIAQRAAELERQQKASAAKLSAAQSQQGQEIAAVNTEVSGVKHEVGAAKTDIQKTQTDLAATNAKLEHAMGDLGVQSGLIAHNSSELEMLKRKGERNYYDFTLEKNARTPVSTISMQLKKVDPKKSKFTLNVIADDRTIEKKDRTLLEPLQFYTGRDRMLYEVVVFTANKNSISGYLSTPKTAPTPVTP